MANKRTLRSLPTVLVILKIIDPITGSRHEIAIPIDRLAIEQDYHNQCWKIDIMCNQCIRISNLALHYSRLSTSHSQKNSSPSFGTNPFFHTNPFPIKFCKKCNSELEYNSEIDSYGCQNCGSYHDV